MFLKKLIVGALGTNCYIFGSESNKEVVIIDPGGNPNDIKGVIEENLLKPLAILLTHTHFDHTQGVGKLIRTYKLPLMFHKKDRMRMRRDADRWLEEGDIIEVGEYKLHVLETPGHTPGGISFYTKDVKQYNNIPIDGIIFTGDLIFRRSIGRSDFPGGDQGLLFRSIKNKIMYNEDLTDNFVVLSGHMGATTIGDERKFNMFKSHFL
jgi:hydroxyacylglutathione hydrolase